MQNYEIQPAFTVFLKMNYAPDRPSRLEAFGRLLVIMDELRLKCPWDKEQTRESIRHLTLEESFELSEAILSGDDLEIRNELGDLLLHIVFYSRMAEEQNTFDIEAVIENLCQKLIRRHPHIYANTTVDGSEQVKENWEQIKLTEGKNKKVLAGVPAGLPALLKAIRIQDKARNAGFDWDRPEQVMDKVREELGELEAEIQTGASTERIENELGDLLFSIVNYARFVNINPEDALEKTNRKFMNRFSYMEDKTHQQGKKLKELELAEMEILWEDAKKLEKPL